MSINYDTATFRYITDIVMFMYALAGTVASRVTKQEDYIGATPVLAILPFFFAGTLFSIGAMPGLSLVVVALFAAALSMISVRVFTGSAVR